MPRRNHNVYRNKIRPIHQDILDLLENGEIPVEKPRSKKASKRAGREKAAYHTR